MNINEQLNQGQKEYSGTNQTNYFKFENGDNRIRILTEGSIIATHFFGKGVKASTCYGMDKGCPFHADKAPKDDKGLPKKPSIKYTCYVVDIKDSTRSIQLADLPFSVIKQIGELQSNIDYSFDRFPIQYDITVRYDKDSNSPNDMYKVIPSPRREEVAPDILEKLSEAMMNLTPEQSVEKKKEYQIQKHQEEGIWLSPEQIAENKRNWRVDANKEQADKIARGEIQSAEPSIEYPSEEINPNDIPF